MYRPQVAQRVSRGTLAAGAGSFAMSQKVVPGRSGVNAKAIRDFFDRALDTSEVNEVYIASRLKRGFTRSLRVRIHV